MSEELKNRVLAHRINKALPGLSKIREDKSLRGMDFFKVEMRQLKPEFEEAKNELNEMFFKKETEIIPAVKRLNKFLFIAKITFGLLALNELSYIGKNDGTLAPVLAVAFGVIAVFLFLLGRTVSLYCEKVEVGETILEIDEMQNIGKSS